MWLEPSTLVTTVDAEELHSSTFDKLCYLFAVGIRSLPARVPSFQFENLALH